MPVIPAPPQPAAGESERPGVAGAGNADGDGGRQRAATGIALALAGVFALAAMDALLKILVARYGPLQLAGMRGALALPFVLVWAFWRGGGAAALRTRRLPHHAMRALVGLGALVLFTMALRVMAIADAVAIAFAAPLFMTALSVPLLGERVGAHRWTAVIVGFAGVLVIIRPGSGVFGVSAALVLAAAALYALMIIWMRGMTRTETTAAIVAYSLLTHAVIALALAAPAWVPVATADMPLFVGLGISGAAGHLLLAQAYRLAPVPILAPFDYVHIIWAVLFGFLIWGDLPDPFVAAGAAIVVLCGLHIVRREALRRLPRARPGSGPADPQA